MYALLDTLRTSIRAWPVCLRCMAVEHVQLLVRSLSLFRGTVHTARSPAVIPRSPQLAETHFGEDNPPIHRIADWLWSLMPREDGCTPEDAASPVMLTLNPGAPGHRHRDAPADS